MVGIGASAGGLEALEEFPAQVPPASGLADLVVQHLDPTQKAMLAQLLQRATPMPVREATERLRIAPHAVYVIPPNRALTLTGGMLHLTAPEQPRGLRRPIDELFESIASEQQEHAVTHIGPQHRFRQPDWMPTAGFSTPSAWCFRAWEPTARWG